MYSSAKPWRHPRQTHNSLAESSNGIGILPNTGIIQRQPAKTSYPATGVVRKNGLPSQLRRGIEKTSGQSMADVEVHYNSSRPAQLRAHAFAQGNQIHLAPGQEKHLPHEAWHVVQQKEGRVRPTMQMKGKGYINDDNRLEREADVMGQRALKAGYSSGEHLVGEGHRGYTSRINSPVAQLVAIDELVVGKQYKKGDLILSYASSTTNKKGVTRYKFNIIAGHESPFIYFPESQLAEIEESNVHIEPQADEETKAPADIKERPETEASHYDDETCQNFGLAAIDYARGVIPLAGNQQKDVQQDPSAQHRSAISDKAHRGFLEYVRARGFDKITSVPPFIRQRIAVKTQGGMCGDYATLVYKFLRSEGLPARIFKSHSHGSHAWVVIKSNTGTEWFVDAWPTDVRDIVQEAEFFTAVHNKLTSEVMDDQAYSTAEKEELLALWIAFDSTFDYSQALAVQFAVTNNVSSTRKAEDEKS